MEPILQNDFRSTVFMTKLFLEDIELILRKLEANSLQIEIVDNENKYDSIQDIIDSKGKNPKHITIKGRSKDGSFDYILIRLSDITSSVVVSGPSELILLGYEIEKLFKNRKRSRIYYFINSYSAGINIVLNMVLTAISYLYHTYYKQDKFEFDYWIPITVFWIFILIFSEINPLSNSKIHLERKHQVNFYKNNKDKILLVLLTAIITAIITLILSKYDK